MLKTFDIILMKIFRKYDLLMGRDLVWNQITLSKAI